MTIGEIIKRSRKELHLSQADLGKMIDTNDADISRIEKGSSVSVEKLVKLAEVLNLDLMDILTLAGYYPSEGKGRKMLISGEEYALLDESDIQYINVFVNALVERRKECQ